jgi:uncharacterized protein YdaU (DUF1376 family)
VKIRRVDWSPTEWLEGTSNLTVVEKGCYITVCSLIYARGEPIDDDPQWISRSCNCDVRTWKAARRRLLALGKIRLIEPGNPSKSGNGACGKLTNNRCEQELAKAVRRVISSRSAADGSAFVRRSRTLFQTKSTS